MKVLQKSLKKISIFLLIAILLSVLAYAVFATYDAYVQMVVKQQQQHLLIISRAVSQSLDLYITEQLRDVDILTRTPGFLSEFRKYYETKEDRGIKEYVLSYMLSQHQGVSRMYLLDRHGNQIFKFNRYPFLEEFDEQALKLEEHAQKHQSGIGTVFQIGPRHYGMTLVNSVYSGKGFVGTVVGVIDLDGLYEQFVAPLDVRDSGYLMVKTDTGTVIMHPDKRMLTFNYQREIKGFDTLPQYDSLRHMLAQQYEYEEGTAIYRTYSNGILPPEDEITAFSRMNMSGISWFVSAVMPYSEAIQPVNENLGRFGLLVSVILVLMIASITVIYSLQKNRQKLKLETRYLRDINHTLEELHQSREQVRHYQKLQTIGALAGGIAHEFNNLLTPIMGYSEFIKEQMGPKNEFYEDIDEIYKAGARAKEIVEQILPFSRRETDSTAYSAVSLDAVVRDALKMVRMILPSSIQLVEKLQHTGVNVYGSATQLNQVLLNLCTNAYQAMGHNGGILTISTLRVSRDQLPKAFQNALDGEYICISIADTGCGMEEQVIQQIFDPFFTTKAVGEGTGLGLSVVQNILISHGGFIGVKSLVGEGSNFLVYLPVTEGIATRESVVMRHTQGKTAARSLLLVDDESRVVRYLKKRLTRMGFLVDAYTDPEEALKNFRKTPNRWDILIADYTMPGYKGTMLAQQVHQFCPELPVLMITGLVEKDALQMQKQKIINEIMIKPLKFDALLATIERLLSLPPDGKRTNETGDQQ